MSLRQGFLKTFQSVLAKRAVFTSFPMSLLLIPLELLSDAHFSCPCDVNLNKIASVLVFSAPFFLFLALMFLVLQPLKYNLNHKKFTMKCKDFSLCFIPSFMWVILLLLDGNYVACWKTNWNGVYVSDDHTKMKWCKPTESIPGRNDTELQDLTRSFVTISQLTGNILLLVISILMLLLSIPHFVCAHHFNCYFRHSFDCIEDNEELTEEKIWKLIGEQTVDSQAGRVLLSATVSEIANQGPQDH